MNSRLVMASTLNNLVLLILLLKCGGLGSWLAKTVIDTGSRLSNLVLKTIESLGFNHGRNENVVSNNQATKSTRGC